MVPVFPGSSALLQSLRSAFPGAREDSLAALVGSAAATTYHAGEEIRATDDVGPPTILVTSGAVARLAKAADGRDIAYGILREGELGGISNLANELLGTLSLVAWTEVTAIRWGRDTVRRLARADGGLALDLLDRAVGLVEALALELEIFASESACQRTARVLLRYPDLLFDPDRAALTRTNLTTLMGASREMMERCLRDLEARRIVVRTGAAGLVLLDEEALRLAATEGPAAANRRADD
ncbi:MAG: Crp/Fnr family transcriptional regulator [Chloroflexota bacterium]|nr:MAG: Crp/Fnr family transcriptional regulator [Chloroflexota bacterium]